MGKGNGPLGLYFAAGYKMRFEILRVYQPIILWVDNSYEDIDSKHGTCFSKFTVIIIIEVLC